MNTKEVISILLVEDNEMDVVLTLDAFRNSRLNPQVQVVRNGEDALKYLYGDGQFADRQIYPLPDLILLDLKMPGMDGHHVLREVKNTPVIRRIPVVILSSSKQEKDINLCYDHGANSYLEKPISFSGFLDLVDKIQDYWSILKINPQVDN